MSACEFLPDRQIFFVRRWTILFVLEALLPCVFMLLGGNLTYFLVNSALGISLYLLWVAWNKIKDGRAFARLMARVLPEYQRAPYAECLEDLNIVQSKLALTADLTLLFHDSNQDFNCAQVTPLGSGKFVVEVTPETIGKSPEARRVIVGHECGHIVLGSFVYVRACAAVLCQAAQLCAFVGLKSVTTYPPAVSTYASLLLLAAVALPWVMAVIWCIRQEEYAADLAGANVGGLEEMALALWNLGLKRGYEFDLESLKKTLDDRIRKGTTHCKVQPFSIHPPEEKRVRRLLAMAAVR